MPNNVIRRVDKKTGIISTIAGKEGDFKQPHSIALDREGRLLVCDIGNNRVRRVDLKTSQVETWLGGLAGSLKGPRALAFSPSGELYLVLREGNVVLKVDQKTGATTVVAGTGKKGWSGDGGPALQATFNGPKGIAFAPDGSYHLADTENHVIRKVDGATGIITTVAGSGKRGDGPGDGGDDSVGGADPRGCAHESAARRSCRSGRNTVYCG
jgi:DNA-binding beta-propeller fold protein YncE